MLSCLSYCVTFANIMRCFDISKFFRVFFSGFEIWLFRCSRLRPVTWDGLTAHSVIFRATGGVIFHCCNHAIKYGVALSV